VREYLSTVQELYLQNALRTSYDHSKEVKDIKFFKLLLSFCCNLVRKMAGSKFVRIQG
jgi:hypothetical protein